NHAFEASGLVATINQTYLTQTDQNGKVVTLGDEGNVTEDQMLVVVNLDVRTLSSAHKQTLNTGLITLRVGDKSFARTNDYNNAVLDIGTPYIGQELSTEFTTYIMVFKIPTSLVEEKMQLKFNDNISYVRGEIGAKNIYINLKPQDL